MSSSLSFHRFFPRCALIFFGAGVLIFLISTVFGNLTAVFFLHPFFFGMRTNLRCCRYFNLFNFLGCALIFVGAGALIYLINCLGPG